jgi:hypothetical protein
MTPGIVPKAVKANLGKMGDRVLLVEGVDDWHATGHLILHTTGVFPTYELGYCENDDGVLDALTAITEASQRRQTVIGAVLDADRSEADGGIQERIRSLQGRLGRFYGIPDEFPPEGLVLAPTSEEDRLPILGIWLMPDNVNDGIFEDLLCAAIASVAKEYVSKVVDKAKDDSFATFRTVERSKAIVKTHIAWQDPNKKNLGEAIPTHFAELNSATSLFVGWLKTLFNAETPLPVAVD